MFSRVLLLVRHSAAGPFDKRGRASLIQQLAADKWGRRGNPPHGTEAGWGVGAGLLVWHSLMKKARGQEMSHVYWDLLTTGMRLWMY